MNLLKKYHISKSRWNNRKAYLAATPRDNKHSAIVFVHKHFAPSSACTKRISKDNLPISHATHCVKKVQIRSYFWPEYRKIRTRNNAVFGNFSRSDLIRHQQLRAMLWNQKVQKVPYFDDKELTIWIVWWQGIIK